MTSDWCNSLETSLQASDRVGVDPNDHGYFGIPPLLDLPPLSNDHTRDQIGTAVLDQKPIKKTSTEAEVEDIWLLSDRPPPKRPEHRTWAQFEHGETNNPPLEFISESSSGAFDALLSSPDNPFGVQLHKDINNVSPSAYCGCLLSLALGRSSLLFSWNEQEGTFSETLEHVKIPGYSHETLAGVFAACRDCGNTTRYLRSYVDNTYGTRTGSSQIALAHAVDKLLSTVQAELGVRGQKTKSLLQLQALVRPPQAALSYFGRLVRRAHTVGSDEQIISLLFQEVQDAEHRNEFLHNAVCEILRMVAKPWMGFVEEWIGLKPEDGGLAVTKSGPGRSFVKVENRMWVDDQGFELEEPDFFLDERNMPSFMPGDMAQEIFETGRNLRFLRSNHPDHVLARQDEIVPNETPSLQWQFDWDAITRVEDKVKDYESALLRTLQGQVDKATKSEDDQRNMLLDGSYELQFFGKDETQVTEAMLASIKLLDQDTVPTTRADEGGLTKILRDQLFDQSPVSTKTTSFAPHWSLLPLLSFGPTIAAQARLVSGECMRLLFAAHGLRDHLQLQSQYHLLGNGLFCSRLSQALFDPNLDTAERESGVALSGGTMGLRLSGRETWPPASSELRLALMGVLADSYEPRPGPSVAAKDNLLAAISFAVRDLPPDEIEKCVDPDSLEALDFLRLSYKPPSALLPIMTPVILAKYDKIFRFLLRILRMLYVVNQLFRDVSSRPLPADDDDAPAADNASLRFRIEAHHFVTRLTAYSFDCGIGAPWRQFEDWLDGVQERLARDPVAAGAGTVFSPDRVRDYHEQVLDDILRALLLRKRQHPVLKLLEDIFTSILQFAKQSRQRQRQQRDRSNNDDDDDDAREESSRSYRSFKKKVEVFVTVCRGLSEKGGGGYGVKRDETGGIHDGEQKRGSETAENSINQLLLLLDMSGYFTR